MAAPTPATSAGTPAGSPPCSESRPNRAITEGCQVPPQRHQEQTEQLGQEHNGRHPNHDLNAGILHWHWSTRPALCKRTPGRPCDRAIVNGIDFTALTRLCWTRMPMLSVTSATASMTARSRCGRPVGRSRPRSRRERGQRRGLLHPDSSCRDVQTCPYPPRTNCQVRSLRSRREPEPQILSTPPYSTEV